MEPSLSAVICANALDSSVITRRPELMELSHQNVPVCCCFCFPVLRPTPASKRGSRCFQELFVSALCTQCFCVLLWAAFFSIFLNLRLEAARYRTRDADPPCCSESLTLTFPAVLPKPLQLLQVPSPARKAAGDGGATFGACGSESC